MSDNSSWRSGWSRRPGSRAWDLAGADGLLAQLTKRVLETALEAEKAEHLGYDAHQAEGRNGQNSRNGRRSKTVLTGVGPVEIDVPRDRESSFEPVVVKKRQRKLDSIDQIVMSPAARGLTTGEISAHFAEVYGASVGKDAVSRITEKVVAEMLEWQNRPLDRLISWAHNVHPRSRAVAIRARISGCPR